MVVIVQSTAIVAGSGIEARTVQVQTGGIGNSAFVIKHGGILNSNIIRQFGGFDSATKILQFTGAGQDTHIVNPSVIESTATVEFILFPKDFSRTVFLAGVVGTSGTVEKFFDRSPFFFTPSETDPNTLRDISEAQQFLIFSECNITTFDPFRNIPNSTFIITDRGIEGSDLQEIITNGSFEQDLSGWTVQAVSGTSSFNIVTSQPTGVGFNDSSPVSVPNGTKMLHVISRNPPISPHILRQTYEFGTYEVNSSQLRTFAFSICPDAISTNSAFQANLIFRQNGVQKANLQYRISGLGTPSPLPAGVTAGPIDTHTLTGFTADVFNSVARNIREDLNYTTFEFNTLETWFIFDDVNSTTDILFDNVGLTMDIPQRQLQRTTDVAHINTNHPVASGFGLLTVPLTISGAGNINQVDLTPPFFAETSPLSGTQNVPETSQLSFHIQDLSSAVSQPTIFVWANHTPIVSVGIAVTGTEYPIASKTVLAPNDILYTFTPSPGTFSSGEIIAISGSFADLASVSNLGTGAYEFQIVGSGGLGATISGAPDVTAPTITPVDPQDLDFQVSANTDILFSITDDASGVDPATVKLYLNGALKIDGDTVFAGDMDRVANASRGFDYTYNPVGQFTFGQTITGTIEASDFVGNSSTLSYQFTITPDDTLTIENFFLGLDQSMLLTTGTLLSVDVRDELYGVSSGTSYLTLNGVVPSGLYTVASGLGVSGTCPALLQFQLPLYGLVDFREDLVVVVHAENCFPGPYPIIQEQQFTLRPGYEVRWPNKTEDQEGGPESIFPYITNIQVLAEIKNYAKKYGEASAFYRFLTEGQHQANLGAIIISNVEVADLPATLTSLNPFFEYGKTMTLEIEADDLEGNQFRLTHVFTIEESP
jgi:hypothetical protein